MQHEALTQQPDLLLNSRVMLVPQQPRCSPGLGNAEPLWAQEPSSAPLARSHAGAAEHPAPAQLGMLCAKHVLIPAQTLLSSLRALAQPGSLCARGHVCSLAGDDVAWPRAAAGWAGQRGRQGSGGSGQGCRPRREQEHDLAAWLCCHGVSREMVLPRIIGADGLVLRSAPDGWGGEWGKGIPVGSGYCQPQTWPCSPSPGHPRAAAGRGARERPCCLPCRAWGAPSPMALPMAVPTLLPPLLQMEPSMRWGEWVQTPLPRRWSVSTSQRRTTGSPCPPCPPPAMGPPPSCRATRSSSWVGAAEASRASPCTPALSLCCLPGLGGDLVHPRVALCCPPTAALQPVGPILLAEPTDGAGSGRRQPQRLVCVQGAGRASCLSPPSRPSTWRRGTGHATPACPADAPLLPAPWPMVSSSAWGGCSSRGPTISIPVPTLSTPWRCSTPHRVSSVSLGGVGVSPAGPGCLPGAW